MGVDIREIIEAKDISWGEMGGKKMAIDAYNALYQFLAVIRQPDGKPLMDSKGRITSHLSGLYYRTINLIERGIRPVYVFDGKPPEFKRKELEKREEIKKEATRKFLEAKELGLEEKMAKYAKMALYLTKEMVEDAKRLLDAMGIPWVQAPSEGEAQAAYMCAKGSVWASASQDYDSLLFGSPRLIRNLTISGKRKIPRKDIYVEIKPEIIELQKVLERLNITREQLILIGILVGTDYNPGGIKGIGPKTALEYVKRYKTLENIKRVIRWGFEVSMEDIYNWFLNPDVTDNYKIEFRDPNKEEILKILVDEHEFSEDRVLNAYERMVRALKAGAQVSLSRWFG